MMPLTQQKAGTDAVTVVIPNWNGLDLLSDCLSSLFEQTLPPAKVILVDDGSTDDSVRLVRSQFPQVHVIRLGTNGGFCRAANVGFRAAASSLVALVNNDTAADPRWLEELAEAMAAAPEAGSAMGKMLFKDRPERLNSAGLFMRVDGVARDIGYGELDGPQYDKAGLVFGASGGAAVYRRAMLEDVGLFDEDFVAYSEDVDLSFRAQLQGWQCLYVPSAVVYHQGGTSYRPNSPQRTFYSSRNMLTVILKDFPTSLLLKHWHQILLAQLYQVLYFRARGQARPVIRGKLAALKTLPSTYKKRKAIQTGRKVSDRQIESLLSKALLRPKKRALRCLD